MIAQSQSTDEQWYACFPNDLSSINDVYGCGNTDFRETEVTIDGQPAGKIAFAPFQLRLGRSALGAHALDITAFGNRVNAFGPLHHTDENLKWVGPGAWRSSGNLWTYGYQFKRMGILVAPTIKASAD